MRSPYSTTSGQACGVSKTAFDHSQSLHGGNNLPSITLHLNTRLSYVMGQSRAAPHRRVSNIIHRYGLILGENIPLLREVFTELELSALAYCIADLNTEHMNSRTFLGAIASSFLQKRENNLLLKIPKNDLDALEEKVHNLSLIQELALLDLLEQKLAKP